MPMLILFIIAVVVLIAAYSSAKLENEDNNPRPRVTACDIHKWVYKDDQNGGDYMVCDKCGILPGRDDTY